jgi:competence protein ComEC
VIDIRMALPAATTWAAALACTQVRDVPITVPIGLAVVAVVLIGTACAIDRGRLLAAGAVSVALAAAAAGAVTATAAQRVPPVLERAASTAAAVDVRVVVTGAPVPLDGPGDRAAVSVEIRSVEIRSAVNRSVEADPASDGSTAVHDLSAPAVMFVEDMHDAAPGDQVGLRARIEPGREGDREAFVLSSLGGEVSVTAAAPVLDAAAELRGRFVDLARDLPGDGGDLLPGLAVGDTSLVSEELEDRMTGASLSHLTAVSGANCALVVGAVVGALALCGARRSVRVAGGLVALGGFVVLVTPEPSVVRAAVMAAIVLLSVGAGRRSAGAAVLFLAVIVCLLADPWLSREFGFALSVAATAGLLFLAGPLTTLLQRVMPTVLAAAVALPLAAQLACQPIVVLLDPSVPLGGIPANMLAAPAAPVVTILGMGACLLVPVLPGLASVVAALAWVPSQWIAGVAAATDDAPLARLPGPPGAFGVAAALGVLLLVAAVAGARSSRLRRGAAVTLLILGCGYLAVLGGVRIGQVWSRPGDWSIAMCDVGQGDAVLVRSGEDVALVDTGPDPEALDACLSDLGIGRIDLLILSHFDADHVGGVAAVAGRSDVVLHQPLREADDRTLVAGLAERGARAIETTAGVSGALGSLAWRALWPPPEPSPYTGNDGSVVIEFGGEVNAIFLGDLGADSELALLAEGTVRSGYATVKFAHHGSADQYDALYERIGASLALVSCGADNDYGHPTRSALALLARTGAAVARSDRDGTTLVAARGSELVTWSAGPRTGRSG